MFLTRALVSAKAYQSLKLHLLVAGEGEPAKTDVSQFVQFSHLYFRAEFSPDLKASSDHQRAKYNYYVSCMYSINTNEEIEYDIWRDYL